MNKKESEFINTLNTYQTVHKESVKKNKMNQIQKGINNKTKKTQELSNNMEMKYTFSTIEGKCYICGKPGHKSPQCKLRNKIPKEGWTITKANQTHAMEIDEPVQQKNSTFIN